MFLRFAAIGIGLLAIITGLAGMVIGGLVAITGTALDVLATPGSDSFQTLGGYALIVTGVTVMIAGLIQIIFGIGVWKLSGWAWILGVIIQSLSFTGAALGMLTGAAIPASLVTMAISGAMLAFLLTPHVRKAFGRGGQPTTKPLPSGRLLQ